jgi:hypothetical protein
MKIRKFIDLSDLFDLPFEVLKITNDSKHAFGLIDKIFIIVDVEKSDKDKYLYVEKYQNLE